MSGSTLPIVVTAAGLQPIAPQTLWNQIIALAETLSPGITATLPGSLIDDITGTDTATLVLANQAMIELMNSLTPYGCNLFTLQQLGQIYLGPGSAPAPASNTGVFVVFTGPAGYPIPTGFLVSDGTHQYAVQYPGGIINSGGVTQPLSALATIPGSWPVIANSVTQVATSIPTGYTITVTNPLAGSPGGPAQTASQYRTQVLQAGLAAAQGMPNMLKTALQQVQGVIASQISVRTPAAGQWEIIVGGSGDPYEIGYAIYTSLFDVSSLTGSIIEVANITASNPGTVTTDLNHNYAIGQSTTLTAINPSVYDGTFTVGTVLSPTSFTISDTSGHAAYINGGTVTPNFRNTSVAINSYPDTYTIPYVIPPSQATVMTVTWNTSSNNFVSQTSIAQLAQLPLAAYINALPPGAPINLGVMESVFYAAIASILAQNLITKLTFSVTIDGVLTPPEAGTLIIAGDPESTFSIAASSITVAQG